MRNEKLFSLTFLFILVYLLFNQTLRQALRARVSVLRQSVYISFEINRTCQVILRSAPLIIAERTKTVCLYLTLLTPNTLTNLDGHLNLWIITAYI